MQLISGALKCVMCVFLAPKPWYITGVSDLGLQKFLQIGISRNYAMWTENLQYHIKLRFSPSI